MKLTQKERFLIDWNKHLRHLENLASQGDEQQKRFVTFHMNKLQYAVCDIADHVYKK